VICGLHLLQTFAHPALSVEQYPGHEVRWVLKEASGLIKAAEEEIKHVEPQGSQLRDEPARPHVPGRFSADIRFTSFDTGYPAIGNGFFAQDLNEKALRSETLRPFPGTEQLLTNMTSLILGDESYDITGGNHAICRQLPMFGQQRFADMFSWAANPSLSEYVGKRVVAGKACTLWQLRMPNKTAPAMTLCSDGDAPIELNMSLAMNNSGGGMKSFNVSYQFGPLTEGSKVPEQLFVKPAICDEFIPPCENGRGLEPILLDAYVFHPGISAGDYNIEDQNVADLQGDALFICMDCLQNQKSFIDHNYTLISRYTLEVSPAFGQYALCNGYPDTKPPGPSCIGGDPRLVGKEAPFFAGDGELRCVAESPIGFWFGLPKGGRCPPGQTPSKDAWRSGCTWSVQKRLKTIHQACLLKDHDYLQYCKADVLEKKGFPRSVKALQAAFASEDPSAGGCKDIGGPDEHSESVVVVGSPEIPGVDYLDPDSQSE